jgi:hypothetical protein
LRGEQCDTLAHSGFGKQEVDIGKSVKATQTEGAQHHGFYPEKNGHAEHQSDVQENPDDEEALSKGAGHVEGTSEESSGQDTEEVSFLWPACCMPLCWS